MPGCKITVLKRMLNEDLAREHVANPVQPCELFTEGQEFLVPGRFRQAGELLRLGVG